jgi:hypothetical protein
VVFDGVKYMVAAQLAHTHTFTGPWSKLFMWQVFFLSFRLRSSGD